MSQTLEATFDGEVFRPTGTVELQPNTQVQLIVTAKSVSEEKPKSNSSMDAIDGPIVTTFPPSLVIGARVWTERGYRDHGPVDGAKVNIAPKMGGTITSTERPYFTMSSLLYCVKWDNGQASKHYSNGLFCIGRFQTLEQFREAITIMGSSEVTLGPQGGFRQAVVALEFDGVPKTCTIYDGGLWSSLLEPIARHARAKIVTIKLPPKSQAKR